MHQCSVFYHVTGALTICQYDNDDLIEVCDSDWPVLPDAINSPPATVTMPVCRLTVSLCSSSDCDRRPTFSWPINWSKPLPPTPLSLPSVERHAELNNISICRAASSSIATSTACCHGPLLIDAATAVLRRFIHFFHICSVTLYVQKWNGTVGLFRCLMTASWV